MKTLEISSNLLPIISVGMYDGQTCDVNNFIDSYTIDDDLREGYIGFNSDTYWDNFDNDKFKNEILERAKQFIEYEIKQNLIDLNLGIKDIIVHKIVSPAYYNFSTDSLYFDLITTNAFNKNILKVIKNLSTDDADDLAKFLKDNFTSYDGFHSYTDNNISDLIDSINDNEGREICAFLTWYIQYNNVIDSSWNDYLYEDFPMYTEFLNDDFIDNGTEVKNYIINFVNDNYSIMNRTELLTELTNHYTDDDDVLFITINSILSDAIASIESNTLKLF